MIMITIKQFSAKFKVAIKTIPRHIAIHAVAAAVAADDVALAARLLNNERHGFPVCFPHPAKLSQ